MRALMEATMADPLRNPMLNSLSSMEGPFPNRRKTSTQLSKREVLLRKKRCIKSRGRLQAKQVRSVAIKLKIIMTIKKKIKKSKLRKSHLVIKSNNRNLIIISSFKKTNYSNNLKIITTWSPLK